VHHELHVVRDESELAVGAARLVATDARVAVAQRGIFTFAVSGGQTPWLMFSELARDEVPWDHTVIYQVDERVAPDGDPERNLTHLQASLNGIPGARIEAMPVDEVDLDGAADAYARQLPEQFDLLHLGLGADGHTASLVPGDPLLAVQDRLVGVSLPYQGHRRMTLTYPSLARADKILWLVSGVAKRMPLSQLLAGDTSIPAGRVEARRSVVLADAAAAGSG
jgi:6-phosphogluconolactonase